MTNETEEKTWTSMCGTSVGSCPDFALTRQIFSIRFGGAVINMPISDAVSMREFIKAGGLDKIEKESEEPTAPKG